MPTLLEEPCEDRFVAKKSCGFFPVIFVLHGEDIELGDKKPMWGNRRLNIIVVNFAIIDVVCDDISFDGIYGVWTRFTEIRALRHDNVIPACEEHVNGANLLQR